MKNPMSTEEMKQAIDDVDAGRYMQYRTIGTRQWVSREYDHGKPLNFSEAEYRRKPEPLVRYTHVVNDALSITSENLQDALDSQAVHRGGVIYRMVEDPDWVEPEPAIPRCLITGNPCGTDTRPVGYTCQCKNCIKEEPDPNPWRKIVPNEWPEGGPMSKIEIRHENGRVVACFASDFRCDLTNATHWRYAEDE